jgi:hypothetical protein
MDRVMRIGKLATDLHKFCSDQTQPAALKARNNFSDECPLDTIRFD